MGVAGGGGWLVALPLRPHRLAGLEAPAVGVRELAAVERLIPLRQLAAHHVAGRRLGLRLGRRGRGWGGGVTQWPNGAA